MAANILSAWWLLFWFAPRFERNARRYHKLRETMTQEEIVEHWDELKAESRL